MRPRTKLELLRTLRQQNLAAQGFTLIELMVVVAIVGILAALALPRFIDAKNAAEAGAKIGEAVGPAKECSVYVISGIGSPPSGSSGTDKSGVTWSCSSTGGSSVAIWPNKITGVQCLGKSATNHTQARIGVESDGSQTCTFS